MPIYAYKCESCGHTKDVLQKMSDPLLTDCPQCGAPAFKKQVTAAGFQLKGSGWYVTDFRGGSTAAAPAKDGSASADPAGAPAAANATGKTDGAAPPAASAPAASAAPVASASSAPSAPTAAPGKVA